MCGIAGYLALSSDAQANESIARAMCDVMVHRGPDDAGYLVDGPLAMGMRRLSIIDLSGGHQPIENEDGSIAVVQNGEIYNFQELREDLEKRGHTFRTKSDTEVIVHLYEEYGADLARHLRGMFAFAVWDKKKRRLVLGRDRVGIKPLYYSLDDRRLIFGSELKTLLAAGLRRDIDTQALSDYLTLTHIPAPGTIFKDARKLEPGTTLVIEPGSSPRFERYWRLDLSPDHTLKSEGDVVAALQEKLDDAVRSHLVSDVPLGVFLSGGVDSATMVACMRKFHTGPLKTFSIGFEEKTFSELDRAKQVAEHFETDHHELVVTPDAIGLVPQLVKSFDEPYADSSAIPVLSVARLAREHVTVALSGEGGDEIFAGYKTYSATVMAGWYRRLTPAFARNAVAAVVNRLPVSHGRVSFDYMAKRFAEGASLDPIDAHLSWKAIWNEDAKRDLFSRQMQDESTARLFHQAARVAPAGDLLGQLLAIDTLVGLEGDMLVKADRMTMAVSLEGRVPLLDHPLVDFVTRIPSRLKMKNFKKKYLLKQAVKDLLPPVTTQGPKQGFNVPIPSWLVGPLREMVHDTLAPERIKAAGLFRPEVVQQRIRDHEERRHDYSRDIWTLLMFQSWYDALQEQPDLPPMQVVG